MCTVFIKMASEKLLKRKRRVDCYAQKRCAVQNRGITLRWCVQSAVSKKMATVKFTHNSLRTKTLKTLIKTNRKVLKTSNLHCSIHNVDMTGRDKFRKKKLCMCLLAVLGSQGMVIKCTAAIVFPYGHILEYE